MRKINEEVPLCKICLEPITNFVCPDCLLKAVQQWMQEADPKLVKMCKRVHIKVLKLTSSQEATFCVVCKNEYYHLVCVYDYIKEFYSWLEFVLPEDRADEFIRKFSFGFKKHEFDTENWYMHKNKAPIGFSKDISDTGVCENCENFSNDIKPDRSHCMVCESCR